MWYIDILWNFSLTLYIYEKKKRFSVEKVSLSENKDFKNAHLALVKWKTVG
jgi:hypothetical protein